MQRIIIIIFLICTQFISAKAWSQQTTIDSLKTLIEQKQTEDTLLIDLKQQLAIAYLDTLPEKAREIITESMRLAQKHAWEKAISEANLLMGKYFQKIGKTDSAKIVYQKSIRHAKLSKNTNQIERAYVHISLYFSNQNAYDSTLVYNLLRRDLIKHVQDLKYLQLIQNIAIINYNLSDIPNTLKYANEGIILSKKLENTVLEQSLTNVLAATLKQKGELDSALRIFDRSLTLAQANKDLFGKLSTYNNMANIYGDKGNYPKALDYYLLTLKTAEELKHEGAQAVTFNNIAIVYYTLHDYPQTIYYLNKSLDISIKNNDKQNMANTMNNIGELYLKQDSTIKALKYYNKAWILSKQINDLSLITQNHRGKAQIFDKLEQLDSAFFYHKLALKTALKLDSKEDISQTYVGIAKHFLSEKNYIQTTNYAQKAFDIAHSLGKVETIRDAADMLHKANAHMIRFKSAYEYLTLFNKMNDSLLNADNTKEITQLEMQYKYQKEIQEREAKEKIKDIERQKEIVKQKIIRNTFIVAFLIVSVFVIIIIRSTQQKQKANKLLAEQKAEIEEKNEELRQLMAEVSLQKNQIEDSHTRITDSIKYAQRIQSALFPLNENFKNIISDHLIFYKPLNIVSGDFYWIEKVHNHLLIAVADCTGHGVPGAMMSMLGISYLNEISRQTEVKEPSDVLEKLRKRVKRSLHQTGNVRESRDGMDIAFVAIDLATGILSYSGANNPIIIFRNNELIEFKADKQPIAIYQKEKPFTNQYFKLEKNDVFYLFTDGYRDQFNNNGRKKYGSLRFKKLLQEINSLNMEQQHQILKQEIDTWMQNSGNQIDDILIAGFRW